MPQYRSAMGKMVDMTQLASKNEHVRAVGNMKVNARGDTIDGHNNVIVPVTKKVSAAYGCLSTNSRNFDGYLDAIKSTNLMPLSSIH